MVWYYFPRGVLYFKNSTGNLKKYYLHGWCKYATMQERLGCWMYEIKYYIDSRGVEPVKEFVDSLGTKQDKNSKINYTKIVAYMRTLRAQGTTAGLPTMRHIEGEIWELRPVDNRILFAAWDGAKFILLHHFLKQTQQTPRQEIETAKRRLEMAKKEAEKYE
jgi:phage-related protein